MVPRLKTALVGPLLELEQRILDRVQAPDFVPSAAVVAAAATV